MNKINVVLISDKGYVLPTIVTIYSIVANKLDSTAIDFYIICNGFDLNIKRKIQILKSNSVKFHFLEQEIQGLERLHAGVKGSYCVATPTALLKFKIAELLKNLDKVLYLDGDIIVRKDLSELVNCDLGNNFAAVSPDTGALYSQNPRIKKYKKYFNSGVMLLNLKKLRDEKSYQKLIEIKKSSQKENLMDQNVFNEYFDGHVKYLSTAYNCLFVNLVRSRSKFSIADYNKKFGTTYRDLSDIEKNAAIIHFSSKDKPWKYSNIPLADEWYDYYLKYCSDNDFRSDEIDRGLSLLSRNDATFTPKDRADIIVSLTTYPGRINIVHMPIEDMLAQTIKPKKIILYLSRDQFPNEEQDLPKSLTKLKEKGVEIKFVDDDIKAHKKYFYALQEYPKSNIITIDDDLRYNSHLIERLLLSHYRYPRAIIASRVHLMTGDKRKDSINKYNEWIKEYNGWINKPSMQLFATHGAGTLFPPRCLNLKRLLDLETIKATCLDADDIWLKVNEVLSNTSICLAHPHEKLALIENSQENALWKTNVIENKNDIQLLSILGIFNKINSKETVVGRIFKYSPFPNEKEKNKLSGENESNNVIQQRMEAKYYYELYLLQKDRNEKLKNSISFKIGRAITFVPRKIISNLR